MMLKPPVDFQRPFMEELRREIMLLAQMRAAIIEGWLVEAIRLSDYDAIDRIHIVYQDGCLWPGIASQWKDSD